MKLPTPEEYVELQLEDQASRILNYPKPIDFTVHQLTWMIQKQQEILDVLAKRLSALDGKRLVEVAHTRGLGVSAAPVQRV